MVETAAGSAPVGLDERLWDLEGHLGPRPRGPFLTAFLGLSGLSFLSRTVGALLWLTVGLKRPAALRLSERGLELESRTELMGRVLRDRSLVIPVDNIASVTREIRYAGATLYAGLVSLCAGTFVGVGLIVDGLRVASGSMSLLGLGLAIVVIGLALDFGFMTAFDSRKGACRLVIRPRRGKAIAVSRIPRAAADSLLRRVADYEAYSLGSGSVTPPSNGTGVASPPGMPARQERAEEFPPQA